MPDGQPLARTKTGHGKWQEDRRGPVALGNEAMKAKPDALGDEDALEIPSRVLPQPPAQRRANARPRERCNCWLVARGSNRRVFGDIVTDVGHEACFFAVLLQRCRAAARAPVDQLITEACPAGAWIPRG